MLNSREQLRVLESQRDRLLNLAIEATLRSRGGAAGAMRILADLLTSAEAAYQAGDGRSYVLTSLAAIGQLTVIIENQKREAARVESN